MSIGVNIMLMHSGAEKLTYFKVIDIQGFKYFLNIFKPILGIRKLLPILQSEVWKILNF
jgi:hypothetical protein